MCLVYLSFSGDCVCPFSSSFWQVSFVGLFCGALSLVSFVGLFVGLFRGSLFIDVGVQRVNLGQKAFCRRSSRSLFICIGHF